MVEQYFASVVLETAPDADIWACFGTVDSITNSLFLSELGKVRSTGYTGQSDGPNEKIFERSTLDAVRGLFSDHHATATDLDTHKFPVLKKGEEGAITMVTVSASFNKYTRTLELDVGAMGHDRLRMEKFMNDAVLRLNGDSSIPRPEGAVWKVKRFSAVSRDRETPEPRRSALAAVLNAPWTVQVGGGLAVLAIAGGATWVVTHLG